MKNMRETIYFILFFIFLSCSNQFDEKRENIIGEWEITQATQEIRADTVHAESATSFCISFNEDGTGRRETIFQVDLDFDWLYQFNPEMVVISTDQTGSFLNNVTFYEVLTNKIDRQIWVWEVEPTSGVADVFIHSWRMERK